MNQITRPQGKTETPEKKKTEDKGFFVQLPCYLIDEFQDKLTSTAFIAFLRFIRKYSKKGESAYKGSYRALAKALNISHTSAIRVTDQWQEVGLATKKEDEDGDMLTITVSLAPIWQKNIEYSKSLDACPNLGKVEQNVTTQPLTNGSVVTENATSVTNCDTAVKICYNLVTFCSTFEDKSDPRYREITRLLDTFFGARESDPVAKDRPFTEEKNSYSQDTTATNENENESQFEVPSFYAGLPVSWLQETTIAEQSPSQVSVPTPQIAPPIVDPATSLFPTEEKPAKQHTFGNLREGLGTSDVRQITPAQQKKLDEAEKRHKEAAEKKRKEDIWILYGKLTGSKAIRDLWSEKAVKALAEGEATDEQITQTYTWLKAKKMSTTLSYIASNLNSCVASTKPAEKPKSELKDFTHMTDEEFEAWRRRA